MKLIGFKLITEENASNYLQELGATVGTAGLMWDFSHQAAADILTGIQDFKLPENIDDSIKWHDELVIIKSMLNLMYCTGTLILYTSWNNHSISTNHIDSDDTYGIISEDSDWV